MLYPMIMRPHYRYGAQTPWGGDGLSRYLGKEIPDEHTGESLEVSALPGMESVALNGALAGKTLLEVFEEYGSHITGLPADKGFPLLVKLIHTAQRPSVQVHPGDIYAEKAHGKLGKTEAWVILYAPPGAKLVTGVNVKSKEEFLDYVNRDAIEACLDFTDVKAGDVYYIPHGQIHASAEGVLLYEIQQSSDVTYRFYDWNRVDANGKRRALHLEDALQVARFDAHARPLTGVKVCLEGGSLTAYVADEHFELWQASVEGTIDLPFGGRMVMLTALDPLTLMTEEGEIGFPGGASVLIPAGMKGRISLSGQGRAILAITPDADRLCQLLGDQVAAQAGHR